jgi:hypothetical protein
MDLFDLINSSEGLGSEDVTLDLLDRFRAFIADLSTKVLWLLLVAYLLQHLPYHLGDLPSFQYVIPELANIPIRKVNSRWP